MLHIMTRNCVFSTAATMLCVCTHAYACVRRLPPTWLECLWRMHVYMCIKKQTHTCIYVNIPAGGKPEYADQRRHINDDLVTCAQRLVCTTTCLQPKQRQY